MAKMDWGPVWFAAFVLLVLVLGTLLHKPEPVLTRDQREAQRLEQMAELEATHCRLTGHPSHEAELAGYVCP